MFPRDGDVLRSPSVEKMSHLINTLSAGETKSALFRPGLALGLLMLVLVLSGCESSGGRYGPGAGHFDTVVVDAGHGGHDTGARARFGSNEKHVALDTARRQAEAAGHGLGEELLFLASHGLLHLLGWDHPDEAALAAMLERQERLLAGAGERA